MILTWSAQVHSKADVRCDWILALPEVQDYEDRAVCTSGTPTATLPSQKVSSSRPYV